MIWHRAMVEMQPVTLRLKRQYSRRVRRLLREYRPAGIFRFEDTVALVCWQPGRQDFTDTLVRRLLCIGAVTEEED